MAEYNGFNTSIGATWARFYNRLVAQFGGTSADYKFEWGGNNPNTVRVKTALEGVTNTGLTNFITAHGTLTLETDVATIPADAATEATITCSDETISADTDLDYCVQLNQTVMASGTLSVTAGVASLTFSSDTPGVYVIELSRQGVNDYESGYISITVTEV